MSLDKKSNNHQTREFHLFLELGLDEQDQRELDKQRYEMFLELVKQNDQRSFLQTNIFYKEMVESKNKKQLKYLEVFQK